MSTCTIEGCSKPRRARGLCATHYNQTLPNRHRKVTVPCEACGEPCQKEARNKQRYGGVYCSMLCRDYARWGGSSCTLPAEHWARMYGATCEWLPPLIRNTGSCEWCGQANDRSSLAAYCSATCKKKARRVRRIGREHDVPGEYTWTQLTRLWRAFDRRCAYCRQPTGINEIQAEHVIALANGGWNDLSNILPSCGACNSDKRDLALAEWATDRQRRGKPPVVTEWTADDTRYRHLDPILLPGLPQAA